MSTARGCWLILTAGVLSAVAARAGNPLSAELLMSYTTVKTNLLKMAQRMPESGDAFRPVPEVETFARRVAHIAGANYRTCAGLKGESKTLDVPSKTTKAELIEALEESFAYCDTVFSGFTDAAASEMVNGRIGSPPHGEPQTRLSTMWNVVRHSNEMYGYMSVYLRLNGVVPPSSSPD